MDTANAFRDDIFTVVGGDVDLFEISEDGKIKTKRKFDYETEEKRTFELVVALSDRDKTGYPKLTTQEKLTITLQDLPEVPEVTSTEFSVDENSKEGVLVGVIKSTDPDGDGKLIYEMTEPSPYVTVSKDGEIKVAKDADIDYEKMQEFTITVTVKDEDGLQSLPQDIVIKVNDLNEPPTIKPQTFVFYEDDPPGTKTGPIEASDPDTKNEKFSKLTYSLVDSSDVFSVTPEGDVVVKSKLDYETQKSYVVKVAVTDGLSSDTTDVTIKIENVVEKSEVEITRVEAGDSIYVNPPNIGLDNGITQLDEYIIQNKLVEDFKVFLKNVSGQDFTFVTPNPTDKFLVCKFKSGIALFDDIASTGTLSLQLLYFWLKKMDYASFVFIDEFDAFYHFKLAFEVCKQLFHLNCQVFTSSHNTYLMTNDLLRPDCNFILQNNKIKPLHACTEKELRFGHNIEKIYRANAFHVE